MEFVICINWYISYVKQYLLTRLLKQNRKDKEWKDF